jgi:hypothetical protein
VPPGRWRISLESGTVTTQKEVDVRPGDKLPVVVELGAAKLTARKHAADESPPENIVFTFTELGPDGNPAPQATFESGAIEEVSAIIKAGRWRISATDADGHADVQDIELKVGEERILELTLK